MSTSPFCVFHRNASSVDAARFVEWSHAASPEEYIEAAKRFTYRRESPSVVALRERMERHQRGEQVGIASHHLEEPREPGDDLDEAAA